MLALFQRLLNSSDGMLKADMDVIRGSVLFDAQFYGQQVGLKETEACLRHFCKVGWRQDIDPSPFFLIRQYRTHNPDVFAAQINPLAHYLRHGAAEGRKARSDFNASIFLEHHPELQGINLDPLSLCIRLYGGVRWKPESVSDLTPETGAAPAEALPSLSFSAEYYRTFYPDVAASGIDEYYHYVNFGWREDRNPTPYFDTRQYLGKYPDVASSGVCPFTHYIERGRTEGRLPALPNRLVFENLGPTSVAHGSAQASQLQLGVHAHCFFPELIGEMVLVLSSIPASTKVVFTVKTPADAVFIRNFVTRQSPEWQFEVREASTIGRDIGPLFVECEDLWRTCDIVLHIHTKRSLHTHFGDAWRRYLFDQCLGSAALVERVLETFAERPDVAMLYPENFYEVRKFVGLNGNESQLAALCRSIGVPFDVMQVRDFAAGSMAWFRTSAYQRLVDHLSKPGMFAPVERIEGTLAHVAERAFVAVAMAQGHKTVCYATPVRISRDYALVTRELPVYRDVVNSAWARDTARIAINQPLPLAPRNRLYNPGSLNIHWIIPSFGEGAGGHMTIFRFVEFFERFGHRQTIWIQNASNYSAPIDAKRVIQKHYRPITDNVFVRFLPEDMRQLSGDVIIATDCWTVFPAVTATNFKERFYFIQDYEAYFHPVGANFLTASQTFDFGLCGLCAGEWLLGKAKSHGMWARKWDLACDKEYYFPGSSKATSTKRGPLQIAYYARANTPRRAVDLGLAAFAELARRGVDFHVHLYGDDGRFDVQDFRATEHGILSPAALGELYRKCDIGVVFSATNYSLAPLEMMACDLPVVEVDTESTRAVFHRDEVIFAKPNPVSVADAVEALGASEEAREKQRRNGRRMLDDISWEGSARDAEQAILERLTEIGCTEVNPAVVCAPGIASQRKASVFIPVKNGGPDFKRVVEAILAQKTSFEFDFLVIDSGSNDGTLEMLKDTRNPKLRVHEIPNAQFQHGATRNLGIEMTDGDYVAIVTADALPASDRWLENLIGGFDRGSHVAGVTGRHFAYPEHGPFVARDQNASFDNLANVADVSSWQNGLPSHIYPGGIEWQMLTLFYSDNNSAMSRAVWRILPYPKIDWGEDMVWAYEAIKLGFEKVYVDSAAVYHSHDWPMGHFENWSAIEGGFWMEAFGFDVVGHAESELANWNARDRYFAISNGIDHRDLRKQLDKNRASINGRARGIGKAVAARQQRQPLQER